MPKEGFDAITLPSSLTEDIENFVNNSNKLISGKSEAVKIAWLWYKHQIENPFRNRLKLKIGSKIVGDEEPTFIIADISTNHDGDISIAKKIIDMAAEEGCDAVKFIKKNPEKAYSIEEMGKIQLSRFGQTFKDYAIGVEFGKKEYDEINEYCKKKEIIWFAECWDEESVEFIEAYNPLCYEIPEKASGNEKLMNAVKKTGKPVLLKTEKHIEEIKNLVSYFGEQYVAIINSSDEFPLPLEKLYLKKIATLKKIFKCPIGHYGNDVGVATSVMAVMLGASIIEKKVTYDRAAGGLEHAGSVEHNGLRILVRDVRSIPLAIGEDPRKFPYRNR